MSSKWKNFKLSEFCTKIGSGATPTGGKSSYSDDGEIALIRSQNVLDFVFSYDGLAYINSKQAKKLSNVEIEIDDVLINITGDSVARVCKVPENIIPARVNQHVSILRVDKSKFSSELLKYLLLVQENKNRLLSLSSSGATRNALTKTMLENFEVFAPEDTDEQQEIADILKSLDDKIANNNLINQSLEEIAQALFKSWFVDFEPVKAKIQAKADGTNPQMAAMLAISGKSEEEIQQLPKENQRELTKTADLFPDEFEESELGLIPKGWKITSFGKVTRCFDSKRIPLSKREREIRKGSYRYIGATSVMDYIDDFIFDGTFLLMGEDGSVIKENGTPFLQYVWGKFWVNNHAHVLVGKSTISTEQLLLFLRQTNISEYVTGAVQLKLNQKNMNSIPFILSTKEISNKFQIIINQLFKGIKNLTDENKILEEQRDALIPKLLSGELTINKN